MPEVNTNTEIVWGDIPLVGANNCDMNLSPTMERLLAISSEQAHTRVKRSFPTIANFETGCGLFGLIVLECLGKPNMHH